MCDYEIYSKKTPLSIHKLCILDNLVFEMQQRENKKDKSRSCSFHFETAHRTLTYVT